MSKKSEKTFRIGLRDEKFYFFFNFICGPFFFSVIFILWHKWGHIINSIFIVDPVF